MNHRDDWAEHCLYTGISGRAEYRLYSERRKFPCVTMIKQGREYIREQSGLGCGSEFFHGTVKQRIDIFVAIKRTKPLS